MSEGDVRIPDAVEVDERPADRDLTRLRRYVTSRGFADQAQLPAERELAEKLDITRSRLRTCLAKLEREGILWRHVGKGTFVGTRPAIDRPVAIGSNPIDVMGARLFLEPEIARKAALLAHSRAIDAMREYLAQMRECDFEAFEYWDRKLHQEIAVAAGSPLLLAMFDLVQANRHYNMGGLAKRAYLLPERVASAYEEHSAIVDAIADRDAAAAGEAMHRHLASVEFFLFE